MNAHKDYSEGKREPHIKIKDAYFKKYKYFLRKSLNYCFKYVLNYFVRRSRLEIKTRVS